MGKFMKFHEIWLQHEIFMILGGPWPARAGNLDIPIGILRFLSLPGPLRSLQKQRKSQNSRWNRSFPVQNKFLRLSASKMAPERYVYKGFLAGAAKADFCSARCVFGAQRYKRLHFTESIGFYRIIGSCGLQPLDFLKDFLKNFLKDFLYGGHP